MALSHLLLRRGVRETKAILTGGFPLSRFSCLRSAINNNNNNNKSSIINSTMIFFNTRRGGYCTSIPPYPQLNNPDFLPASPFAKKDFQSTKLNDVLKCAHFAVDSHNVQKDGKLQFRRLLNAGFELVGGYKVFIMLEATAADDNLESYLAIVFWLPWTDYKELVHFGHVTW